MIVRVCDRCGKQCRTIDGPKLLFKTVKEQAMFEFQDMYLASMDLCDECWNSFSNWYSSNMNETNEAQEQDVTDIIEEIIPEIGEIQVVCEEEVEQKPKRNSKKNDSAK